jgi:hypothetical protein
MVSQEPLFINSSICPANLRRQAPLIHLNDVQIGMFKGHRSALSRHNQTNPAQTRFVEFLRSVTANTVRPQIDCCLPARWFLPVLAASCTSRPLLASRCLDRGCDADEGIAQERAQPVPMGRYHSVC